MEIRTLSLPPPHVDDDNDDDALENIDGNDDDGGVRGGDRRNNGGGVGGGGSCGITPSRTGSTTVCRGNTDIPRRKGDRAGWRITDWYSRGSSRGGMRGGTTTTTAAAAAGGRRREGGMHGIVEQDGIDQPPDGTRGYARGHMTVEKTEMALSCMIEDRWIVRASPRSYKGHKYRFPRIWHGKQKSISMGSGALGVPGGGGFGHESKERGMRGEHSGHVFSRAVVLY